MFLKHQRLLAFRRIRYQVCCLKSIVVVSNEIRVSMYRQVGQRGVGACNILEKTEIILPSPKCDAQVCQVTRTQPLEDGEDVLRRDGSHVCFVEVRIGS